MNECKPRHRQFRTRGPIKYRYDNVVMTRAEAIEVRAAHLQGRPVLALELQEACRVLSKKVERRKLRLPELSRPEKERINAVLLFNLGRALGRFDERKAA